MILGITGNIGAGKSSVAREFQRLGAALVDADQLAREVVEPGSPVLAELVEQFGREILNSAGRLDREALGRLVFSDDSARQQLNRITHPAIAERSTGRLNQLRRQADIPLVVYEAALLYEAGAEARVDRVLVVKIDPQVQLQRLMARDGCDEQSARQKIAAQMPQNDKLARADYVIDNSLSLEETRRQVEKLWPQLLMAGGTG
jgi:dephospho-CoA kinase